MAKKYHISRGMNFGGSEMMDIHEDTFLSLAYSDNLLDYFDKDTWYMQNFLVEYYGNSYTATYYTPEYRAFEAPYVDEEGDIINDTPEFRHKQLETRLKILGGDSAKVLNEFINNTKAQWKPCIEYITQIMEMSKNVTAENLSLPQKSADGTIKGSFLTHNFAFSENAEDYVSRKDLGILASEWFGKSEVCCEGRMCSFFTKQDELRPDMHNPLRDGLLSSLYSEPETNVSYTLILDATNPDLQPLLQNDFFTYVKNKDNPEYLQSLSDIQLNTFQNIESWSNGCKSATTRYSDWVAIPGGVPSRFAIGLIAHNIEIDDPNFAMCQEAADIFNVPLLNSNLDIVYVPEAKLAQSEAQSSLDEQEMSR